MAQDAKQQAGAAPAGAQQPQGGVKAPQQQGQTPPTRQIIDLASI